MFKEKINSFVLWFGCAPVVAIIMLGGIATILCLLRSFLGFFSFDDTWGLESFTYAGYVLALCVGISYHKEYWKTPLQKDYCMLLFLCVCALLREMGVQHWLTNTDTTAIKIKFFTNPANPLGEKIRCALILILVGSLIAYLVFKYTFKIARGFFRLDPLYWTVSVFGGVGFVSQMADRFPANYRHWTGTPLEPLTLDILKVIEEGGEAILPFLFILGLYQHHLLYKRLSNRR